MNRDYLNSSNSQVNFFVGNEVEKTDHYNKKTLFVVGIQDKNRIIEKYIENQCVHIYFGANMSFNNDVKYYEMIDYFIDNKYVCSIDFDFKYFQDINNHYRNKSIILICSVKILEIESFKNLFIKIDDNTFNYSNSGVWVHKSNDLLINSKKTEWKEYKNDKLC